MARFGVEVAESGSVYSVNGDFRSPGVYAVESDWSSACFPLVAGAFGDVTVRGLDVNSRQGDRGILEILKKAGAEVVFDGGVRVKKGALKAFSCDLEDMPDAAPVVAVLAAACEGRSVLTGTGRLKLKESDRGAEIVRMLASFGVQAKDYGDRIEIVGGALRGGELTVPDDHRIAMAAAIAAVNARGDSVLKNAECVAKSYPSFFDDLKVLGGKAHVSL